MTVRVRTRAPRSHLLRRLARRLTAVAGSLLLVVGSTVGMLVVLLPAIMLLGVMGGDGGLPAEDRAILGRLGRGWLVAVAVTITGCTTGAALLRSRRGMVLWLRRFRDTEAVQALASALDHIGRSWRIVTLDDAEAPAVGVAPPLRVTTRIAGAIAAGIRRVAPLIPRIGRVVTTTCVVAILASVGWSVSQGRFFDLLATFPAGRSDALEAQALTVAVFVLLAEFALLIAYIVVMLAILPLLGLFNLVGTVAGEIRKAEQTKHRSVRTVSDAQAVAGELASASGQVIAPRLSVLTVDDAVWRQTVRALAAQSHAVLIDVSVVTANVSWEVEEVDSLPGARPVFVGDRARVDPDGLAPLLGAREVLVYDPGLIGRWRFQRALFNELETTLPPVRLGGATVRRIVSVAAGLVGFVVASRFGLGMIAEL